MVGSLTLFSHRRKNPNTIINIRHKAEDFIMQIFLYSSPLINTSHCKIKCFNSSWNKQSAVCLLTFSCFLHKRPGREAHIKVANCVMQLHVQLADSALADSKHELSETQHDIQWQNNNQRRPVWPQGLDRAGFPVRLLLISVLTKASRSCLTVAIAHQETL